MAAISVLNPKAEVARAAQALAVNMSGAKVSCLPFFYINFYTLSIKYHISWKNFAEIFMVLETP
jgi:hypothetical protein